MLHCRTGSSSAMRCCAPASSGTLPRSWHLVDHPARLLVCARCRTQVLLCSRCDRGQRYCGRICSRAARVDGQREAARRYQSSRAGRMAHAARSRRWRQRQRQREPAGGPAATPQAECGNFVTHQGSPRQPCDAPLVPDEPAGKGAGEIGEASPLAPRCCRCTAVQPPWVRQGFLRHGARRWPARVIDPCP